MTALAVRKSQSWKINDDKPSKPTVLFYLGKSILSTTLFELLDVFEMRGLKFYLSV